MLIDCKQTTYKITNINRKSGRSHLSHKIWSSMKENCADTSSNSGLDRKTDHYCGAGSPAYAGLAPYP